MKESEKDEISFPLDVPSKSINFLQKLILFSIKCLAFLMTLMIIWTVIDVGIDVYRKAVEAPYLLISMDELLRIFGSFLVVLIAIEIFLNIILYLRKDMGHLRLVVATALMAIARKIIILDYDHSNGLQLFAMASVIAALGFAYLMIVKSHQSKEQHLL